MADYHKIDAFFNGEKKFEEKSLEKQNLRKRLLRHIKLILPSLAAVLVGCILVFPSLKNHPAVKGLDETLPHKGELEKLHMEKTVFTTTDKNNKISTFTADSLDETSPGSKIIKIVNPQGTIPTEDKQKNVKVDSKVGYYDQSTNTFQAEQNVKAVYPDGTTVLTESAEYDFNKAYGSGRSKISAEGPWGSLEADGFEYDQTNEILFLNGRSKTVTSGHTIYADKQLRYYQRQNRLEADKNVKVIEGSNTLYADKMKAYLKPGKNMELKKLEAFGNVRIDTPDGRVQGNYGIYLPEKAEIELHNNVMINRKGNVIYGAKAVTNLKTSVSRIISDNQGKRVSGVITGSTIKGSKHEKK